MNGSGVLFYDNFGDVLNEYGLGDCFIIPSAVHEILLCLKSEGYVAEGLTEMLMNVNETQMEKEEQLADYIFEYDSKSKEMIPVIEESLDIILVA